MIVKLIAVALQLLSGRKDRQRRLAELLPLHYPTQGYQAVHCACGMKWLDVEAWARHVAALA